MIIGHAPRPDRRRPAADHLEPQPTGATHTLQNLSTVHIQTPGNTSPIDHAGYTAPPTRQEEPDHTDHTDRE